MIDEPITSKQKAFIQDIMEFVDKPFEFENATKQSASKYISENIEMYRLMITDSWALSNGYF